MISIQFIVDYTIVSAIRQGAMLHPLLFKIIHSLGFCGWTDQLSSQLGFNCHLEILNLFELNFNIFTGFDRQIYLLVKYQFSDS